MLSYPPFVYIPLTESFCEHSESTIESGITFPAGAEITWTVNKPFVIIEDPTEATPNLMIGDVSCKPKHFDLFVSAKCPESDNYYFQDILVGNYTVYPASLEGLYSISGEGTCMTSVTLIMADCSEFITINDQAVPSLSQDSNPGQNGSHDYTISFIEDIANQCQVEPMTLSIPYSCPAQCPDIAHISEIPGSICSGQNIDLSIDFLPPGAANISVLWTSSDGTVISGANENQASVVLSNTNCVPSNVTIYLTVECLDDNSLLLDNHIVGNVMVFPSSLEGFYSTTSDNSCTTSLLISDECDAYLVADFDSQTALAGDGDGVHQYLISYDDDIIGVPACVENVHLALPYHCPQVCPVLIAENINASITCSGGAIELSAGIDNVLLMDNISILWEGENIENPTSLNTLAHPIQNGCAGEAHEYMLTITCGNTGNQFILDASGNQVNHLLVGSVVVYPALEYQLVPSVDGCGLTIDGLCANHTASWTTDNGASGIGSSYNAIAGTSGEISFTITQADAPASCAVQTINSNYSCNNCPEFTQATCSPLAVCSGSAVHLMAEIENGDGGTLIWYDQNNEMISDPENHIVNSTACYGAVLQYHAIYTPSNANCPTITMESNVFQIYPQILGTIVGSGCNVMLDTNCDNFMIDWEDSNGNVGLGKEYIAPNGTSGTVTYHARFPSIFAPTACISNTFSSAYNCNNCPALINCLAGSDIVCAGEYINLSVEVLNPDGGSVIWYDDAGVIISNPDQLIVNNTTCGVLHKIYYAWYYPTSDNCDPVYAGSNVVAIYPEIEAASFSDGCTSGIIPACDQYEVSYQTSGGISGTGTVFDAAPLSEGSVTFTVTDPGNPAGGDCLSETYTINYECNGCPVLSDAICSAGAVCSGTVISLNVSVANTDGGNLAWLDSNGNIITDPAHVVLTTDECNGEYMYFTAIYYPATVGCNPSSSITSFVYVYPNISVTPTTDNCTVSIDLPCENWFVYWEDDSGQVGTGATYTSSVIQNGSVTFSVVNPSASYTSCYEDSFTYNYNCSCDAPDGGGQYAAGLCVGESINLNVFIGGPHQWFDINGNPVNDIQTLANNGCDPLTYVFHTDYSTILDNGCSAQVSDEAAITVYPDIETLVTVHSDGCNAWVETDCDNLHIYWQDEDGNEASSDHYIGQAGTSGALTFTILNNAAFGLGCHGYTTESIAYNCCSTDVNEETVSSIICSGTAVNLFEISGLSMAQDVVWVNQNGQVVNNPSNHIINNTGCSVQHKTFTGSYITQDNGCSISNNFEIDFAIYPLIQYSIINDGCNVSITTDCSGYDILWSDSLGNQGEGDNYQANSGTQGTVHFTITNTNTPAQLSCATTEINANFDCCNAEASNIDLTHAACSGQSINLNTLNGGDYSNYDWSLSGGGLISNSNNYSITNNTCNNQSILIIGSNQNNADPCGTYTTINLLLTVYPALTATVSNTSCSVVLNGVCPNFEVSWNANGSTGSGLVYNASPGTSGTVEFTITNPALGSSNACSTSTYTGNYNCAIAEPIIDLSLTKTSNAPSNLQSGDSFSYTVTVLNDGPSNASGVSVTDLLPAGLTINSVSPSQGNYNALTGIWSIGTINDDSAVAISFNVTINDGVTGTMINTAQVHTANQEDIDSTPGNNVESEDDQASVILTIYPNDDCEEYDYCALLMTQNLICPEFCGLDGLVNIVEVHTMYNCSVDIDGACLTYIPVPGMELVGSDYLEITACNELNVCVTVLIHINFDNCIEPVAHNDNASTTCSEPIEINVISNDDTFGHAVTICDYSAISSGSLLANNGVFTYYPATGFTGVTSFTYTICDSFGNESTATVYVNVISANTNTAPSAINDVYSIMIDESVNLNVLLNDFDSDMDGISLCGFTPVSHGQITQSGNGFIYTPFAGYTGLDSFTYTVCDDNGCNPLSNQATVTIQINGAPCTEILTYCTGPMTPIEICPEFCELGDNFQILFVSSMYACANELEDQCVIYTPVPLMELVGSDILTIEACDSNGNCQTIEIEITISTNCGNLPAAPIANDDTYVMDCNEEAISLNILANDVYSQSQNILISNVSSPGGAGSIYQQNGQYFFAPNTNFFGTVSVTYTITDQYGQSDNATIYITVAGQSNHHPITANDYAITNGEPVTVMVLTNDYDIDGDMISVCNFGQPSHGSVSITNNSVTYTPEPGYYGTVIFKYIVCDNHPCSAYTSWAYLSITITQELCTPDVASECVEPGTSIVICPDFCTIATPYITGYNTLYNNHLQLLSDGCFRYTAGLNFAGSDQITINACETNANGSGDYTHCTEFVLDIVVTADCGGVNGSVQTEEGNITAGDSQPLVEINTNYELNIPNAFSPNGDGINEVFKVIGGELPSYIGHTNFVVFDVNGHLVYSSQSESIMDINWDGRNINGKAVKSGTYFYVLTIEGSADNFTKKGFIEILR